jgi:hypothetical protein
VSSTAQVREASGALAAAVDALVGLPVEAMGPAQLQALIAGVGPSVDRLVGLLSAAAGRLQDSAGGTVPTRDGGSRTVASWLAEARCTSPAAAGGQLRIARLLRSLPAVAAAVLAGVLTQDKAAVLARLVGTIEAAALIEAQPALIAVAADRDPAELAAGVSQLIATHYEPALDQDMAAARRQRFWQSRPDGALVRGSFAFPAEDFETVATVLGPLAGRQGRTDDRTAGQRRADAAVEVFEQVLRHGELPEHGGQRPQLSYVLPADWAARQHGQTSCPHCRRCWQHRPPTLTDTVTAGRPEQPGPARTARPDPLPAELGCATAAWTGPQTRPRIEALLCEARISRVLLDHTGQVHGLRALRATVTPTQRRALAARDNGCARRGCTRPAAMCDAHHLIPLAAGGPTTRSNLVLLCRRHHLLWHLGTITHHDLHIPWHRSTPEHLAQANSPP